MVMRADLGAAKAREKAFRPIGASAAVRIAFFVIFQPAASSARMVALSSTRRAIVAMIELRCEKQTERNSIALAHNNNQALAVLFDRKAPVAAVLFPIGRLDVAAEIGAVDLDPA